MNKKITLILLLAFFSISVLLNAQIPTNGLVAWYPLCGNANDESGNGNNGTVNGATLTNDRFNNANSAYLFDGVNDYISVPHTSSLNIITNITLSVWVYLTSYSLGRDFIGKSYTTSPSVEPYSLYCNPSGKLIISSNSAGGFVNYRISASTVPLNVWTHVAGTIESNQYRVYINGSDAGVSAEITSNQFDGFNNQPVVIGKFRSSNYYQGKLDDIRIYNRALNTSEITALYNETFVPAVSIAITSGSNPSCSGSSVTFTATPTNGGTTPLYQWKVNGGNVGTNSQTFTTTSLANNDVVTCVMTSNAICVNPLTATSNTITMTVNPVLVPSVSIALTIGSNPMCAGSSATFTAIPTNGGTTPSYQWKVNGGNVGTNSATYTTTTLANNDVITCVMTSNATCAIPATATSNAITMTIISKPITPLITLNFNILHSDAPAGNQWYNESGLISGATGQDYTVTINGDYYVIVTLNGCSSDPSNIIQVRDVGVENITGNTVFKVYPNPVSKELLIEVIGNNKDISFEILNSIGQIVIKGKIAEKTVVQTFSYPPGVYILKLENGNVFEFKKIVKE